MGVSSEGLSWGSYANVRGQSQNHGFIRNKNIHFAYVSKKGKGFWVVFLDGNLRIQERQAIWDQIMSIADNLKSEDDWVVLGDFNQVLYNIDKVSFKNRSLRGAHTLLDCINHCRLCELPPKGQALTWTNNRE